ncbi:hypothetical protein [Rhodococcoides fascians]|uniref:hypothetical protein n=1 Tax=Rhodococcoides fascians TaxID=1828 RepID=UPI0024B89F28|nr:hypothetical protein [Rhodococcus fascians]MDJ0467310.1 hypothetical protein [Rhodococcus fascians]
MAALTLLAAILVAVTRPIVCIGLGSFLILFGDTIQKLTGYPQFGYSDEAAVILVLLSATAHLMREKRKPQWLPELTWFAGFIAIGIISSIAASVPVS